MWRLTWVSQVVNEDRNDLGPIDVSCDHSYSRLLRGNFFQGNGAEIHKSIQRRAVRFKSLRTRRQNAARLCRNSLIAVSATHRPAGAHAFDAMISESQ